LDEKNKAISILKVKGFVMTGYRKMYRKTFRYIEKNKVEHLVLDLRGNGGGMIFHPGNLLSYLIKEKENVYIYREAENPSFSEKVEGKGKGLKFTKWVFPKFREKWGVKTIKNDSIFHITIQNKVREKNHFKGKLYILIDGGCFSATSYTAAFLKKNKRGLFIGEETGGGEKGCNAMVMNYLELPNTKLRYRFPFFRVEHDVTPQVVGRGIFPDLNIRYDKKARLENKDLEMEKVRVIIENEKIAPREN
jgi:C-terminal processing protease CtpA/Prc